MCWKRCEVLILQIMDDYCPLESLRREVKRFQASNRFDPMSVTHFYAQAACVIGELDRARQLIRQLNKWGRDDKSSVRDHQCEISSILYDAARLVKHLAPLPVQTESAEANNAEVPKVQSIDFLDRCEQTWNTCYPDRRPWNEIGDDAKAEWLRVLQVYESQGWPSDKQ